MSTRSLIAIENPDGTCRSIYCHHDGYPDGVGWMLREYYKSREAIEALQELGDLSSIDETLETCCAYHRDRGEEKTEPILWKNREELIEKASDCWAEYVYLFSHSSWFIYSIYKKEWNLLSDVLTEIFYSKD